MFSSYARNLEGHAQCIQVEGATQVCAVFDCDEAD